MDINRSAFSLVIHKNGNVTQSDIDDLLTRYRIHKGLFIDPKDYVEAIRLATERYQQNDNCLFVCTGGSCQKNAALDHSEKGIAKLGEELNCPVELTGCHWQCEHAPVVTLKTADHGQSFTHCSSHVSMELALKSIRALIDQGRKSI
jgi:hypothetical protein